MALRKNFATLRLCVIHKSNIERTKTLIKSAKAGFIRLWRTFVSLVAKKFRVFCFFSIF